MKSVHGCTVACRGLLGALRQIRAATAPWWLVFKPTVSCCWLRLGIGSQKALPWNAADAGPLVPCGCKYRQRGICNRALGKPTHNIDFEAAAALADAAAARCRRCTHTQAPATTPPHGLLNEGAGSPGSDGSSAIVASLACLTCMHPHGCCDGSWALPVRCRCR